MKNIIAKAIRRNPVIFTLMLLSIAGTVILSVLPPIVLQQIVDRLNLKDGAILLPAAVYFILTAVYGIMQALQQSLITVFGEKLTHGIRSEMTVKLERLPASYYVTHDPGVITSCMMNDVDTLESLFDNGIISMIADLLSIISIMIVVFRMSRGLGILLLIALPILFLFTRHVQKRTKAAQKENRAAIARQSRQIPETAHNIRTIHVLQKERYMERRYRKQLRDGFNAMERSNFYDAVYSPVILTCSSLIIAVMMIASVSGSGMQSLFGMSVGTVVALIAYVGKVFSPLSAIGMEIQNIQSAAAGVSRVNAFLKAREMPIQPQENWQPDMAAKPIVIEDLYFGYGTEKELYSGLSLTADKGDFITISGRTGAGKSTLFSLILGLYAPRRGRVLIYGQDPSAMPQKMRRRIFGFVEQNFHSVGGTVRDQITLQDPLVTDEMIESALEMAGLANVIRNLEHGLDTPFEDGLFSQGQLQLLSIARALVCNPPILLLDEITANLDALTERQILQAMQAASSGRTVLSISHRLYLEQGGRNIEI